MSRLRTCENAAIRAFSQREKGEKRKTGGGDVDSTTRVFFDSSLSLSLNSLSTSFLPLKVVDAGLLERPLDVAVPARGDQGVTAVFRV